VIFLFAVFLAIFVLPSPWGIVAVAFAAVVELGETWLWFWYSRRRAVQVGAETLVGTLGETLTACRPAGQIRLGAEFWDARCEAGVDAGAAVRVVGRSGLTLLVEPAGSAEART
jgi:membrane-bound ClpP family serine protease